MNKNNKMTMLRGPNILSLTVLKIDTALQLLRARVYYYWHNGIDKTRFQNIKQDNNSINYV